MINRLKLIHPTRIVPKQLRSPVDLPPGKADRTAQGDSSEVAERGLVGDEEVGEFEEDGAPGEGGNALPCWEGCLSRADGKIDVKGAGDGDVGGTRVPLAGL